MFARIPLERKLAMRCGIVSCGLQAWRRRDAQGALEFADVMSLPSNPPVTPYLIENDGKVALVTGGVWALDRPTAVKFAPAGTCLCLVDITAVTLRNGGKFNYLTLFFKSKSQ
jgi:hypothetical protein